MKLGKADRAITDYILVKECSMSFSEIDNADSGRMTEFMLVYKTVQDKSSGTNKKETARQGRLARGRKHFNKQRHRP